MYRLRLEGGSDAGEATYPVMIQPEEEILVGNGRRIRVLDLVPFEEEDGSPFRRPAKGRGALAARA